jgi:hypothetical protein
MPVIPALRRWREENGKFKDSFRLHSEFQTSMDYIDNEICLKKKKGRGEEGGSTGREEKREKGRKEGWKVGRRKRTFLRHSVTPPPQ